MLCVVIRIQLKSCGNLTTNLYSKSVILHDIFWQNFLLCTCYVYMLYIAHSAYFVYVHLHRYAHITFCYADFLLSDIQIFFVMHKKVPPWERKRERKKETER